MKKADAGCDRYGTQRLELAVFVKNKILRNLDYQWFIENGTLLGAWRNQKFIEHDDDFDIALLIDSKDDIIKIDSYIKKTLQGTKYFSRLITSYSSKIEVFDPSFGKYKLLGEGYLDSDFHYVTLDLQFYLKKENNIYECLYFRNLNNKKKIPAEVLLPVTKITLEDKSFNAPCRVKRFLKMNYGSLDPKAKYNCKTGFYELH